MKFVDEFRDPVAAEGLLAAISETVDVLGATAENPVHIMEVCGGHTHAIFRFGLDKLTPAGLEFIHGPGCPVCVLPMSRVDDCIEIAERPNVILTTFGDVMRVPGTKKSLFQAKVQDQVPLMFYEYKDFQPLLSSCHILDLKIELMGSQADYMEKRKQNGFLKF